MFFARAKHLWLFFHLSVFSFSQRPVRELCLVVREFEDIKRSTIRIISITRNYENSKAAMFSSWPVGRIRPSWKFCASEFVFALMQVASGGFSNLGALVQKFWGPLSRDFARKHRTHHYFCVSMTSPCSLNRGTIFCFYFLENLFLEAMAYMPPGYAHAVVLKVHSSSSQI